MNPTDLLNVVVCPQCRQPLAPNDGQLVCSNNHGFSWAVQDRWCDLLVNPHPEVVAELGGMEREDVRTDQADLLHASAEHIERRTSNFLSALQHIAIPLDAAVLDLGTGHTGWALAQVPSVRLGIGLDIDRPHPEVFAADHWYVRGDRCRLPFRDASFDVLLSAASLHHAYDLELAIGEAARVSRPGAIMILVEPVSGWFKGVSNDVRETGVHEFSHSHQRYLRALRRVGFRTRLLFPAFVDERLCSGNLGGVRLARLGGLVAKGYRRKPVRHLLQTAGLRPGLQLFGIGLVAIAQRTRS